MKKIKYFVFALLVLALISGPEMHNFRVAQAQSELDWVGPINISMSGFASNPVAVVDLEGTIHVIWLDKVDGYRYSWSADGLNWNAPIKVNFPFLPKDNAPSLFADPSGSIHAFWISEKRELFHSEVFTRYFGVPSQWKTTQLSKTASNYDALVDTRGVLHVVYIENVTNEFGTAGVYYRQLDPPGSWSKAQSIYKSEYFRATTPLSTYLRIAVSNQPIDQKIYISWDNRPLKRIFLARSTDDGHTWSEAQQFKGPDDTGSFGLPFNGSVSANGENLLLMWQEGEPNASRCAVYSQWSTDGGNSWQDPIMLFGGPTACPLSIRFVRVQADKVAVLLNDAIDPVLVAWDGLRWSEPQLQVRIPSLSNPITHDAILLGCRQDLLDKDKLIVVGCDQTQGGDIWLLSRQLTPLDDSWFTPPTSWNDVAYKEIGNQQASGLSSATDDQGSLHVVWAQSPAITKGAKDSIVDLQLAGNEWVGPEVIIKNLDGQPIQLTMYSDTQNGLMIAWVDSSSGDLLFSSESLDQANLPSGWVEPTLLPSPSQLTSSPDIVVDSTGRIVVAYAVSFNENRGIYVVQSTDNGVTWSPYIQAFDAVAAQWDSVDSPKIALSGDGVLHLLFTRKALHFGQPKGLYYSQSKDGGVTWSDPLIVSESAISWSDIVTYDSQTVHRLWQEENGLVVANISQVSEDGGATWGRLLDVTNVSEQAPAVALAANSTRGMYFIQLQKESVPGIANQENLTLQDWKWDGTAWILGATRNLVIDGHDGNYSLTAVTLQDHLSVSVFAEYVDPKGDERKEIINFSRFLTDPTNQNGYVSAVLPAPVFPPAVPSRPSSQTPTSTPIVDRSALLDSNDPSEAVARNLVGVGLISAVSIFTVFMLVRRGPKKKISKDDTD